MNYPSQSLVSKVLPVWRILFFIYVLILQEPFIKSSLGWRHMVSELKCIQETNRLKWNHLIISNANTYRFIVQQWYPTVQVDVCTSLFHHIRNIAFCCDVLEMWAISVGWKTQETILTFIYISRHRVECLWKAFTYKDDTVSTMSCGTYLLFSPF